MIVSGGVALIWTDPVAGSGVTWPAVYRGMAALMVGAAVLSALALPRLLYRARKGCAARAPNRVRTAIPLQRSVSARLDLGLRRKLLGKGQG